MNTFKIHKLQLDMLTGQVEAEYSLAADGKQMNKHSNTFASAYAAKAHITGIKRDLLLGWLDNYVNHKKHIIEAGRHTGQDAALQRCLNALAYFHQNRATLGLNEICRLFLRGIAPFEQILPHPANNSYEGSRKSLDALKRFCEDCITEKLAV